MEKFWNYGGYLGFCQKSAVLRATWLKFDQTGDYTYKYFVFSV